MSNPRHHLITQARVFITKARHLTGVTRLALLGSILTAKPQPKDVDVLVTITDDVDMAQLATLGRKLKGRLQGQNLGADIFLANPQGTYLGRTCPWKQCAPGIRMRCEAQRGCGTYLYDDWHVIKLDQTLIKTPPLVVWPQVVQHTAVPEDVEKHLLKYFSESNG